VIKMRYQQATGMEPVRLSNVATHYSKS
jgi:hypothetical protein